MKIEIRPYEEGQGIWIDDQWKYGNPGGQADANVVAHVIALACRERGFDVSYQLGGVNRVAATANAEPPREMPLYECHKVVRALKIESIQRHGADHVLGLGAGATILPEDPRYRQFEVGMAYLCKHEPQPGGYYVVYKDGYESYSPAEAFEEGYTRVDSVNRA